MTDARVFLPVRWRDMNSQVRSAPGSHVTLLRVGDRDIETDSEGYLLDLSDWSDAFARAQAAREGLSLTDEHWQVIRFLRRYFHEHGVQAQVRVMIRHFAKAWGPQRGSNHYLHGIFPRGGPQKQGNRLAGLLRTKGEH